MPIIKRRPSSMDAELQELLTWINETREAEGQEPLPALEPGIIKGPTTCLIARNLNIDNNGYTHIVHYDPKEATMLRRQKQGTMAVSDQIKLSEFLHLIAKWFDKGFMPSYLYRS